MLCKQFGGAETTHNTKDCKHYKVTTEKHFKESSEHMSIHELYVSNQKLTKKLKKTTTHDDSPLLSEAKRLNNHSALSVIPQPF